MNMRPALLRLTAALVAVLAIAAVAASLPIVTETPGPADEDGEGAPNIDQSEPAAEQSNSGSPIILRALIFLGMLALGLSVLVLVVNDRGKLVRYLSQMAVVMAVIGVIGYLLLQVMEGSAPEPPMPQDSAIPNGSVDQPGGGGGSGDSTSPTLLTTTEMAELAIAALILFVVVLAIRKRVRGDDSSDGVLKDPSTNVGSAAGAAADRIENEPNPSVENAVYDAWYTMTTYLPVEEPETSTPGEFAAAATDAGFDPRDVEELTSLFESVRYGPETATPVTEERAVEILRRIESTYAGPESAEGNREEEVGSGRAGPAPAAEVDGDSMSIGTETDPNERDER